MAQINTGFLLRRTSSALKVRPTPSVIDIQNTEKEWRPESTDMQFQTPYRTHTDRNQPRENPVS